jgi:nicotinic acid mononucleotide adenylyltransferase
MGSFRMQVCADPGWKGLTFNSGTQAPLQGVERIGLLPGSFNPPHFGHIELGRRAIEAAALEVCLFYVNSINREKRGELVLQLHRCRLLKLLLDRQMGIVDPEFFSDNPDGAFQPQEAVFLALIEKLRPLLSGTAEIWLVRGSDNFRPLHENGYAYPPELSAFPHVIGVREDRHGAYDYSALRRKVFVRTRRLSSSEVRGALRRRDRVARLIGPSAERYLVAHRLLETGATR